VGSGILGGQLAAVAGTWDSGTTLSYQWFRDDLVIEGANKEFYRPQSSEFQNRITVEVTGSKPGYVAVNQFSDPVVPSTLVPNTACQATVDSSDWLITAGLRPVISGSNAFGGMLGGLSGSWPLGTKLCAYWYSNGSAIAGAFGSRYRIQASDIGKQIQYVVIGTDKSGKSSLRYSQEVTITEAKFTRAQPPKLTGIAQVGRKLVATISNWTLGVSFSYQWLRNGNPIDGAQSRSYVANADDLGNRLSLQVCGSKLNFETMCLSALSLDPVIKGSISPVPKIKISGTSTNLGATLAGEAGNWPQGTSIEVQWLRDGVPIEGETSSTHVISQMDRGHSLTFQVTGIANGYSDCLKVSSPWAIH